MTAEAGEFRILDAHGDFPVADDGRFLPPRPRSRYAEAAAAWLADGGKERWEKSRRKRRPAARATARGRKLSAAEALELSASIAACGAGEIALAAGVNPKTVRAIAKGGTRPRKAAEVLDAARRLDAEKRRLHDELAASGMDIRAVAHAAHVKPEAAGRCLGRRDGRVSMRTLRKVHAAVCGGKEEAA